MTNAEHMTETKANATVGMSGIILRRESWSAGPLDMWRRKDIKFREAVFAKRT